MTYEDVEQSDGSIKRNFTLIAGDTFPATVKIQKDGQTVNPQYIKSVKFKLADKSYNCLFCAEFTYNSDLQTYYLEVPAETLEQVSSEQLKTGNKAKFIYEYELTLLDGYITTLMQANFTITKQITGCANE